MNIVCDIVVQRKEDEHEEHLLYFVRLYGVRLTQEHVDHALSDRVVYIIAAMLV